ncbi:TonB-dependent receptor [Candidatus Poribacteria bacterium]|nr:TonB-dependent receptor [Candidatus Poribacteria bacterium]
MKGFFLVVLLVLLAISIAFAEDREIQQLEEVVVTATRIEEPKTDVPASTQVITGYDIRKSTAKNAADLIGEAGLGNITIRSFTKGGGTSGGVVQLRGFRTNVSGRVINNSVLVLIDGHLTATTDLSQFPVDNIERIEIVKGPASVLYGSSVLGGVINIITKKKGEKGIHCSIGGETGSWEYWKTRAGLTGNKGNFDFYISANQSSQGEYEAKGYGKIGNTEYNGDAVSLRMGYKFLDDHYISLGYSYWKQWDIGRPGPIYDHDPDDYADVKRDNIDVGYKTENFNAYCYYGKNKDLSYTSQKAGPGNSIIYFQERKTQGAGIQKTFPIAGHRLVAGGQWDRIDFEGWKSVGQPYEPSNKYNSYGAFSEGRFSLLNNKLLLTLGLRYDYFENEVLPTRNMTITPRKEDFQNITKRGGIVHKITENLRLKGNIGEAYRAPSPLELGSQYQDTKGVWRVGNPDLDPEKSLTTDGGIEYSTPLLKGGFVFFHTDYKDKITQYYDEPRGINTYKNVPGATIQGVEPNISYDVGVASGLDISIEPFANVTYYTRYSVEDEETIAKYGSTLLDTPKWAGSFGVKLLQEKWDGRLIAKYMGNQRVQDPKVTGVKIVEKGDFTEVDLKGSYKPIKNLEISVSVENLFDRAYEYALYYPMPRRTLWGGVRWMF